MRGQGVEYIRLDDMVEISNPSLNHERRRKERKRKEKIKKKNPFI
jgi:hypothetical protein